MARGSFRTWELDRFLRQHASEYSGWAEPHSLVACLAEFCGSIVTGPGPEHGCFAVVALNVEDGGVRLGSPFSASAAKDPRLKKSATELAFSTIGYIKKVEIRSELSTFFNLGLR